MTNSRLTDPEVLELRYPVLLERFEIRRGSGGKGKWRAGDGTLRVIRFLERMECAILSGFRTHAAVRSEGRRAWRSRRELRPAQGWSAWRASTLARQTVLDPGEAIIIRTPTGGGFGDPYK